MRFRSIALLTFALTTSAVSASAQAKMPPRKVAAPRPKPVTPGVATLKDDVMMKEGKVLVTQMGQTRALTQEMSLTNGTKITPTGSVVTAAGGSAQLQEGDMMSLSGRLTTSAQKAEQDSLLLVKKENLKIKGKKKKG
ncbi:hypothetical protein SAMN00120144_0808 [Hymenobacter roseosalivarius DSM 11622]|uniref:DUF6799 domain-containing protein n=1 Tax=Hymenobacter roseosalivarius DSM 11622 TaxID=645990 RepID=A0A1W1USK8_9BACT|nr:DUF6799 domain-containing protein [Hymenobacter roseosalivarius]SMB84082.1 hypothetical protein SAMN00120144_0808 [Hymenobacter roseosalivarius DSM 11622]